MCIEGLAITIEQQFTFLHNGPYKGHYFFTHNTPSFTRAAVKRIPCATAYSYSYYSNAPAEGHTYSISGTAYRNLLN